MDQQGHNIPLPPFDNIPHSHPYPEQEAHQPRPRRSYWANQYRVMQQTTNFKKQRIPLNAIKRLMKSDEDVHMISPDTLVVFARACEMFIIELTHKGWVHAQERNRLTIHKADIVAAVKQTDYCDFLTDIRTAEEPTEDQDAFDPLNQLAPGPPDPLSYYSMQ